MKNRTRVTSNDVKREKFYQLPKFLFVGEFKHLNNDARVLYSLLKDRHELSIQNNWINKDDEIYFIFSRTDLCELLGLSENTVLKAMNILKKYELIQEERIGLGKPNRIYILTVENVANWLNLKSCGSGNSIIEDSDTQDLRILQYNNKTNSINNKSKSTSDGNREINKNKNDTTEDDDLDNIHKKESAILNKPNKKYNSPIYDYQETKKLIQQNIDYIYFVANKNNPRSPDIRLVDELVENMLDVICTEGQHVKINSELKDRRIVIEKYLSLDSADIQHVVEKYKEQNSKITHIHAYLKTLLYTVKQENNFFYENDVRASGFL